MFYVTNAHAALHLFLGLMDTLLSMFFYRVAVVWDTDAV